ncbi:MAG: CopD family protein [Candidatus Dormibacteria bacterium]
MSWQTLILFVHIIAACVWIGGQITIAAVIPALRTHPELTSIIGRRFQILAWTAFGVLILTGVGNVLGLGMGWSDLTTTSQGRLLLDKLGLVLLSGGAATLHSLILAPRQRTRVSRHALSASSAILGSASLLAALGAALYGVVIARAG